MLTRIGFFIYGIVVGVVTGSIVASILAYEKCDKKDDSQ